ncbi:DUF1009 domain-containing protein [bacterium]|nr:DUF1009 domain-containing protein [bacterium]
MTEPAGKHTLGVIAGGGDLPHRVAASARASGRPVFVLGVTGFVSSDLLAEFDAAEASIGEVGKQIKLLRDAGCVDVVFAGAVKRPDFSALKLDLHGARLLPSVISAAGKGDDALLRVLVQTFEREGFRVIGADEVMGGLLVESGVMGRIAPSKTDWVDIRKAAEVAAMIGAYDIGQGAVSCRGLVLAVEAQEGTDAMLQRCATLPAAIRGDAGARAGVLVKRPKPQQERRIDLPTIGEQTIELAALAGLAGVAVEASATIIVRREAVIAAADRLGVFIYGFEPDQLG